MSDYAQEENASDKTASELEDTITYFAQGWAKGVLDFSEKSLPATEQPKIRQVTPAAAVAQGTKRIRANYATKSKPVVYKDLKRKVMMSGMKL